MYTRLDSPESKARHVFYRHLRADCRSVVYVLVTVCFSILFFPAIASAHAPHDEVSAILLSPGYLCDGIVFAIVRYNILRSTDFGHTWHRLTKGIGRREFRDLAISSSFVIDRCLFAASPTGGIFRSIDAGMSWESLNDDLPDNRINLLTISPTFALDRRLLAVTSNGQLFVTNDAGEHWRHVFHGTGRVSATAIVGRSIVVGTSTGSIHASEDEGRSWHALVNLKPDQSITCFASVEDSSTRPMLLVGSSNGCVALVRTEVAADVRPAGLVGQHVTSLLFTWGPHNNPLLFATTWREAVFRSENLGHSWLRHGAGLTTDRQADWPKFRRPHFKGLTASETFAADQTLFLGGFDGVFKSTDGGTSWREMRGSLSTGLIMALDLASVNQTDVRVAISTYLAGVYTRTADGPWEVNNLGIDIARLSDVAFSPNYASDRTIFALGNWVLFRSTDGGQTWETTPLLSSSRKLHQLKTRVHSTLRRIVPMLTNWCGKDCVSQLKQWFAWISTRVGLDIMGPGWGGTFAVSPDFAIDRTLFIGGPLGVLRSQDGGISFELVFELAGSAVRSLAVSPNFHHDRTVFIAYDEQLYRSVDRGTNWEKWSQGQEFASPRLAISPAYADDQTLFLGCELGLWRSRDGGRKWERLAIATIAADATIDGLAVSPNFHADHELIVQVCGSGLFHSCDEGNTFMPVDIDHLTPTPAASHMAGFPDRASLMRFSPYYRKDRTLFVSSMEDLIKSSDSGKNWEVLRRPVRFENVRPEIVYHGTWKTLHGKMFSSGAASCSSGAGDAAVMEFVGQEVRWIGRQGPRHGMAQVLIDGMLVTTVDQYAANLSFATVSFEAKELSHGPHTIVVEVTSDRNPRSSGNDIVIDAFDVS